MFYQIKGGQYGSPFLCNQKIINKIFLFYKYFYIFESSNNYKQRIMKNLIKQSVRNNGEALEFETFDSFGHIQFNRNEWAIFFNAKCVHVSKTLNSAINKLHKLGVNEFNFVQ